MKTYQAVILALALAGAIGFALYVFTSPGYPDLLELIDNPKF
jgi:hypothetical protein